MRTMKEKLKNLPKQPGIYEFLDKNQRVIYVGKAKNLRSRVGQYFGHDDGRPQIPYLMKEAVDFNYTVVNNELESAFLENTLIKQHTPKYNIDLKDDKNYAFITIDYSFEIPQIGYSRKIQDKFEKDPKSEIINHKSKIKYFGPYSAAYKIKQTLNLVRKIFPYCANQTIGSRPCFYYYLHRCPGICVGKISGAEYTAHLEKITKFLQGDIEKIINQLRQEMAQAAKVKKFETAARLRDQLDSLQILQQRQSMILPKKVDWDIVSLASSDGYGCVNLFKIRAGKMFDKENFVYELPEAHEQVFLGREKPAHVEILQRFLEQYYLETSSRPGCIYTQIAANDSELVAHILRSRFNKKTEIFTPQKGQVKKLVDLGKLNAEEYLKKWLNDKAGNLDKINAALTQLKDVLRLPNIPKRIECYDISNIQGTNAVASMVVFQDGLPAKSQYRKFKIRGKKTPDDFAMMKEALERRLHRIMNQELGVRGKDSWAKPDLIVIDGGKGQLSAAVSIIHNSKFLIPTIGLAKRIEEIFLPGSSEPIILTHDQPALQLLQRIRDEAHRFGITFHRKLRSKEAIKSALDDIPGVGPKTKKLLKQKFGTVTQIKNANADDLAKTVGNKLAKIIKQFL